MFNVLFKLLGSGSIRVLPKLKLTRTDNIGRLDRKSTHNAVSYSWMVHPVCRYIVSPNKNRMCKGIIHLQAPQKFRGVCVKIIKFHLYLAVGSVSCLCISRSHIEGFVPHPWILDRNLKCKFTSPHFSIISEATRGACPHTAFTGGRDNYRTSPDNGCSHTSSYTEELLSEAKWKRLVHIWQC